MNLGTQLFDSACKDLPIRFLATATHSLAAQTRTLMRTPQHFAPATKVIYAQTMHDVLQIVDSRESLLSENA